MNIWFATNNAHKKEELEAILNIKLKIPSQEGLKFNPEETGDTFIENALIKAKELKKLLTNDEDIIISDDSGLCVDFLNGRPGVHSAYYGETDGKKLTSEQKNLLLLDELKDAANRKARFICTMVLLFDMDRFYIIQETLEGEIVQCKGCMKGDGGFGYDPIFLLPQYDKTLAQLSSNEKNLVSHRGKAGKILGEIIDKIKHRG